MRRCPGRYRHWFRDYGLVGLVRPTCVRCGADNPKVTAEQRREWDEHQAYLRSIRP